MGAVGPNGAMGAQRCIPGAPPVDTVPGYDGSSAARRDVHTGVSAGQDGLNVDRSDEDRIREVVKELVKRQEVLHEDVLYFGEWLPSAKGPATAKECFPCFISGIVFRWRGRGRSTTSRWLPGLVRGVWWCSESTCVRWKIW